MFCLCPRVRISIINLKNNFGDQFSLFKTPKDSKRKHGIYEKNSSQSFLKSIIWRETQTFL